MLSALSVLSLLPLGVVATPPPALDAKSVERFANLALTCVHQEYPNKIGHVMSSDGDVGPPRKQTPAFCGCFDWHSSVHGHWLLVRLSKTYPDASFAANRLDLNPEWCPQQRTGVTSRERVTDIPKGEWLAS